MAQRPNIVLIVFHDLGTWLGAYGTPGAVTPTMDRVARGGTIFTNCFAAGSYCSPCRGAMLTGRWPHSNGLMGLANLGWTLPPETETLDTILSGAGYETALFGLQHEVRDVRQLRFDLIPVVTSNGCADVAPVAAAFIRERAHVTRPFYARVGFNEVHRIGAGFGRRAARPDAVLTPVPPYLRDTAGARRDFAEFSAYVRAADEAIAPLLDALEHPAIRERTILVITTDHGIDFPRAKGTLYDPGINTALVLRGAGAFRAGERRSDLVSSIDILPTLLEASGIAVPPDVQGRSFLRPHPDATIYAEKNTYPGDAKRCVRTARWKYIRSFDEGPILRLGTCSEYSLTRRDMGDEHLAPRPPVELYDLSVDPWELRNLAGRPEHAAAEAELSRELSSWRERTADPLLRGAIPRPPEEEALLQRAWGSIRSWRREE